ncbi:MAG: SAM-dependent methyltransferase, partial [Candidatus Accumulibacter sp.]|nr:SAM-dependent methyltransferase [Accumulibacter sp.]
MSPSRLPAPDADAQRASDALVLRIREEISNADGWIGFDRFMEMALYTPRLGYYSGGAHKFGAAGDFVTAPELTPIFAQTLAAQAQPILAASAPYIIEVGAGSGRLAADLLLELERRGCLPERYRILDLSGELRERQRATLAECAPHLLSRVGWLDRLPERFSGLVLANELLDAMPVHLVRWGGEESPDAIHERGVTWRNGRDGRDGAFAWEDRPAQGRVLERAREIAAEYRPP